MLFALLALDHLVSGPTAWQVREEDDFDGDELARITPKVAVCSLARASFPCPPLLRNKASQLQLQGTPHCIKYGFIRDLNIVWGPLWLEVASFTAPSPFPQRSLCRA